MENNKKELPIDGMEVMQDEMFSLRGGKNAALDQECIEDGDKNGCGCGCGCGC
ncbi:MAG: hypothetical protein ACK5M3_11995 [Dysgonomonas sp.]